MIEKILRFLPIYIILSFVRYSIIIIQFPFSYIRSKITRRNIYKINDYNDRHKYILVYVCFQKKLTISCINLLQTAKENGAYIILASNYPNVSKENFTNFCDVFLESANIGRCFSMYKMATQYIIYNDLFKFENKKIIYANDSVFFVKKNLSNEISKLLSNKYDLITSVENFHEQSKYHASSWFFSLDYNVFKSQKVNNFWNRFFEINNRFYNIRHGEVALSKVLLKNNFKISSSFNLENLINSEDFCIENIRYLSTKIETDYIENRHNDVSNKNSFKNFFYLNSHKISLTQDTNLFLLKFHNFSFIKKDLFWRSNTPLQSIRLLEKIVSLSNNSEYWFEIETYFLNRERLINRNIFIKALVFLGVR